MAPAIFDSVSSEGMIAAQQAGAFLNVALGHASLQPVVSNGLAYVDGGEHD
jgi:hypothetical protein